MLSRYYTMEELKIMRFAELPDYLRKRILEDVRKAIGLLTPSLVRVIDRSQVLQVEQYADIYRYIKVI